MQSLAENLQKLQKFQQTCKWSNRSSAQFCDHHKTFKTPAKSRSKFVCHFYTEILQRSQKQDRKTPQKAASPDRASLVARLQWSKLENTARTHQNASNEAPKTGPPDGPVFGTVFNELTWGPKNGTTKTAQKPNTSSSKNLPSNRGGPVLRSQEWWKKMGPKRGPLTRARFDSKHSAPRATQKKQCCEIVSTILKNPRCRENPPSPLDS